MTNQRKGTESAVDPAAHAAGHKKPPNLSPRTGIEEGEPVTTMKTCSSTLSRAIRALLGFAALAVATVTFAGPPMICRSYDIADAKTLPGGAGGHDMSPGY